VEKVASFRKNELSRYMRKPFLELKLTGNRAEISKNNLKETPVK
jgi:hypothetical protein